MKVLVLQSFYDPETFQRGTEGQKIEISEKIYRKYKDLVKVLKQNKPIENKMVTEYETKTVKKKKNTKRKK